MDLFTYLMAKKGKKSTSHKSDLFAYLLATHRIPIKEESGTSIEINAKSTKLIELTASKLSSQHTTTGKNLLDLSTLTDISWNGLTITKNLDGTYTINGTATTDGIINLTYNLPISLPAGTYTGSIGDSIPNAISGLYIRQDNAAYQTLAELPNKNNTFTINETFNFNRIYMYIFKNKAIDNFIFKPQIELGSAQTSYEEYTGGIPAPNPDYPEDINVVDSLSISITNGTDTKTIPIDLDGNEIAGIGDYKDILTIDNNGNVTLTKKIAKVVLDSTKGYYNSNENWYYVAFSSLGLTNPATTDLLNNYYRASTNSYMHNNLNENGLSAILNDKSHILLRNTSCTTINEYKTWLSAHSTEVYYVLATPETIDLGTVDISLYKGTNTITNSASADMTIKYY